MARLANAYTPTSVNQATCFKVDVCLPSIVDCVLQYVVPVVLERLLAWLVLVRACVFRMLRAVRFQDGAPALSSRVTADTESVFAVQAAGHITSMLADLHRVGLVHRQVNARNMQFVQEVNTQWRLGNFDLATRTGELGPVPEAWVGAAPEILKAWRDADHVCVADPSEDMWGVGYVMWEALRKECGWKHLSHEEVLAKHIVCFLILLRPAYCIFLGAPQRFARRSG